MGFLDTATGKILNWIKSSNGAAHTYGLARNFARQTAGTYNSTDILGFWVEVAPTSNDTSFTGVDNASAITSVAAGAFKVGEFYPAHFSSITVGTGGTFLLAIG